MLYKIIKSIISIIQSKKHIDSNKTNPFSLNWHCTMPQLSQSKTPQPFFIDFSVYTLGMPYIHYNVNALRNATGLTLHQLFRTSSPLPSRPFCFAILAADVPDAFLWKNLRTDFSFSFSVCAIPQNSKNGVFPLTNAVRSCILTRGLERSNSSVFTIG